MIKKINILKHVGRFAEFRCDDGERGNFAKLNVVYAKNASGKSTLCDVLRSMSTGESAYLDGRKRLNATTDPKIVVTLEGGPTSQTVRFQNGTWHNSKFAPKIHRF